MTELKFDGETYEPELDRARLGSRLNEVYKLMHDGQWRTLPMIARHLVSIGLPASEAGVSARLRDLRKDRFGAHEVERRRVTNGLWEYRLIVKRRAAA